MDRPLGELAARIGGSVRGEADRMISGIGTLGAAGRDELAFLTNPKYREAAQQSRAAAILVPRGVDIEGKDLLIAEEPYLALAVLLGIFHPEDRPSPGIHPTAVVGAGTEVDASASVGPYAVLGARVVVGPGAAIGAAVVVGNGCRIGADARLHPHCVLYAGTVVGDRSIVHSGVVLGADGFGYATHERRHAKVPQVGRVVLEEDVEVGANSAIDRALLEETRIGAGTKIDDLVMVAHNVRVGRDCLLVAQSGIAGSAQLGDHVVVAGQAGVAGHLRVGDGARVAAKSAVFKSVAAGRQVAGIPAQEAATWRRQQALLGRLQDMHKRLRFLEEKAGAPPARAEGEGE